MTDTLVWDETGARYYETGVSKGIFFPIDGSTGVPWNGLVAVNLDPQGGEPESYYFDGVKYMDRVLAEDFQATIQAISTPKEFERCEGVNEVQYGMKTHFNKRDKFNMSWRTEIGNDQNPSLAYKLHIAYNCLVQPASRAYQTISDSTTMDVRSFVVTTTPACGRHSYYSFDSRDGDLTDLEAQLKTGILPKCWELSGLVGASAGGGGEPVDPDFGCPVLIEDFEEYNPGQSVADDKLSDDGTQETSVYGRINNGLDTVELPAVGAFAANDSAASEVGTGDILTDDDDATYITSADGDLGYTIGLPPLVGYVEGATLELHIRMSISGGVSTDDPDNLDADAQVHISTDAGGDDTIGGFSDGTDEGMGFSLSVVDGTPVDYVIPLSMDAWVDSQLSDVVTALEAGSYLNVVGVSNNNFDTTPEVRVYEASVVMVNATDRDRWLRAPAVDNNGRTTMIIHDDGGVALEASHTSYVDFKILEVPSDAGADGDTIDVMTYVDSTDGEPGLLRIEEVGGSPQLTLYDTTGGTEISNINPLELNVWYTAQMDFGWTSTHVRVYKRDVDSIYLLDETYDHGVTPMTWVLFYAGFFG